MTKPPTELPALSQLLQLKRITPKVTHLLLHAQSSAILFFDDEPLAIYVGGAVYFGGDYTSGRARAINDFHPNAPHVRSDPARFDFVAGQVLTMAGLPLTRVKEDSNGE